MNKGVLIILSLTLSVAVHGGPAEQGYNEAKALSSTYNSDAMKSIQATDISSINTNVDELQHRNNLTSPEASKTYALKNPEAKSQYNSAVETLNERETFDKATLSEAENIANNPDKNDQNGTYCSDGKCNELENVDHTDEMVKSTAVLEDVLGGGQSYNESGLQTKIYTGQALKCQSGDSFGDAINCCDEKGWLFGIIPSACKKEAKVLDEKRKKGLCHFVGDYDVTIRELGIPIGSKQYDGYCCFTSKMALETQVGAKKQLPGNTWGRAKSPNCRGLTSDEFSKLDFSTIDLSQTHSDISTRVVEPSQDSMLVKPDQFYNKQEKGIVSW